MDGLRSAVVRDDRGDPLRKTAFQARQTGTHAVRRGSGELKKYWGETFCKKFLPKPLFKKLYTDGLTRLDANFFGENFEIPPTLPFSAVLL